MTRVDTIPSGTRARERDRTMVLNAKGANMNCLNVGLTAGRGNRG